MERKAFSTLLRELTFRLIRRGNQLGLNAQAPSVDQPRGVTAKDAREIQMNRGGRGERGRATKCRGNARRSSTESLHRKCDGSICA